MKNLLFALTALFGSLLLSSNANAQCTDTCPDTWSSPIDKVITNYDLNPSTGCTYTLYYQYQERWCNGIKNIRFVKLGYTSNCHVTNSLDCSVAQAIFLKAFTIEFHGPFVFDIFWNCCRTLEIELDDGDLDFCFLDHINPKQGVSKGYIIEGCGLSCCKTFFQKVNNNTVFYQVMESDPNGCTTNPSPVPGTYQIICSGVAKNFIVTNSSGCSNSCYTPAQGMYKNDNQSVGINDVLSDEFDFEVFPNPVSDELTISVDPIKAEASSIQVFDMKGRVLLDRKVNETLNGMIKFDVGSWNSGVYYILLTDGNGKVYTKPFEVVH